MSGSWASPGHADMDTARGQEATPLVIDGVIYVTTAWSKVKAYDARTGALTWAYDPASAGRNRRSMPAAMWSTAASRCYGRPALLATLDGRSGGARPGDGAVAWSTVPSCPITKPYTITGAPRVIDGKVIIGNRRRGIRRARLCSPPMTRPMARSCGASTPCPAIRLKRVRERRACASARATWNGELVGTGRRRHRVGCDHLRSGRPTWSVRHRQCRTVEPSRQWPQPAGGRSRATISTPPHIVALHADHRRICLAFPDKPRTRRWDFDRHAAHHARRYRRSTGPSGRW